MPDHREPRPIGDVIREARLARKLQVSRAAALLDVEVSTYTSWEKGRRQPTRTDNRRSLLLGFGVKIVPMAVHATDEEIAEEALKHPDDASRISRLGQDLRSVARQADTERDHTP